ncbi:hypothetical protein D9613_012541 [Agrocybe pediades]|uniref:Uncharacterized protein n=1 Tax=Agrocybe pediades TaxID=84607 RepID=A0A8H4VPJ5_9AGAR|nr:hypothetical protein D9613_012541 [Agrocybe pediades]
MSQMHRPLPPPDSHSQASSASTTPAPAPPPLRSAQSSPPLMATSPLSTSQIQIHIFKLNLSYR